MKPNVSPTPYTGLSLRLPSAPRQRRYPIVTRVSRRIPPIPSAQNRENVHVIRLVRSSDCFFETTVHQRSSQP